VSLTRVRRLLQSIRFAQQRLWFVNHLEPGTPPITFLAVHLTGRLNMAVLTRSVNKIIKRHEVLQTSFVVMEGEPVQVIASAPITLSEVDLRQLPMQGRLEQGDH